MFYNPNFVPKDKNNFFKNLEISLKEKEELEKANKIIEQQNNQKKEKKLEIQKIKKFLKYKNSEVSKIINTKENIDCEKGCEYCCYQNINIFTIEEFNIIKAIENKLIPSKLNKIKENHEKWLEVFFEISKKYIKNNILSNENLKLVMLEMNKKQMPCPYLINKECSIYEYRPLVCNMHVFNDKEKCKTNIFQKSLIHKEKQRILDDVLKKNVEFLLKFKFYPFTLKPLPLSVLDVLNINKKIPFKIEFK